MTFTFITMMLFIMLYLNYDKMDYGGFDWCDDFEEE